MGKFQVRFKSKSTEVKGKNLYDVNFAIALEVQAIVNSREKKLYMYKKEKTSKLLIFRQLENMRKFTEKFLPLEHRG